MCIRDRLSPVPVDVFGELRDLRHPPHRTGAADGRGGALVIEHDYICYEKSRLAATLRIRRCQIVDGNTVKPRMENRRLRIANLNTRSTISELGGEI